MDSTRFVTCNIATHKARKDSIDKVIDSMIGQVDLVRVYYNDYIPTKRDDIKQYWGYDLTDRGKFYGIGINEIAFTCDDDILYPPNYVESTLSALKRYPNAVITYHGRRLRGKGLNFYRGHDSFHCLHNVLEDIKIDVGGTGVMCFDTSVIEPDILSYPQNKMVDILMGLECAKKGVPIMCIRHKYRWLQVITDVNSIYKEMVGKCEVQNGLADELWDIIHSDNHKQ